MRFLLILCSYLLSFCTLSQVLKTTNLNLNAGARVYDVEYIPGMEAYILVGDFTHINNVPRNKVALVDAQTFELKSNTPFASLNFIDPQDRITSVEYTKVGFVNYLVIGGHFETAAPNFRAGMLLYTSPGNLTPSSTFSEHNWNYLIDGYGIDDMLFASDTLFISGNSLYGVDLSVGDGDGVESLNSNFIALKINPESNSKFELLESAITASASPGFTHRVYNLTKRGSTLFLGGGSSVSTPISPFLQKRNANSFTVQSNFIPSTSLVHAFSRLHFLNDSILMANVYSGGGGLDEHLSFYKINGLLSNNVSNYGESNQEGANVFGGVGYNSDVIAYKRLTQANSGNYYFALKRYELQGNSSINNILLSPIGTENIITIPTLQAYTTVTNNIFIKNNKLFFSVPAMTQVNGNMRNGLAVFCMEPADAKDFVDPQLDVCAGNSVIYSIPASAHAGGYVWKYTGTGAKYRIAGSTGAYQNFTGDQYLDSASQGRSIEVLFPYGSTSGTISVRPYAVCNTATDYMFAREKAVEINVIAAPQLSMVDTMQFTCLTDSLALHMSTNISNPIFSWSHLNAIMNGESDSVLILTTADVNASGYFYGILQDAQTLCYSRDSTFVGFDTTALPIQESAYTQNPPLFTCNTPSVTLDLSIPNATINWKYPNDSILHPSPLILYSTDSTELVAIVTYDVNGCQAQKTFGVEYDMTLAQATLNGSLLTSLPLIVDTISCNNESISLNCGVQGGNIGDAEWIGNMTSNVMMLNVSDSMGMHPQFHTQTYSFNATNPSNGCSHVHNVTILFDLKKPFVSPMQDASINCSQDTVFLMHPLSGGNLQEGWLDSNGVMSNQNLVIATTPGVFHYQVVNSSNGCINVDTVNVNLTNELLLQVVADTLVCAGETVMLSVANINNTEETSYVWSTGAVGPLCEVTGGIHQAVTVTAQNQSGCIGHDTITISIPSPVEVQFVVSSACTSAALQVTSAVGGSGSLQFAIDGSAWQTSTVFTDIDYGLHQISVLDQLGCIYNFSHQVDNNGQDPDVNFLVSTYNVQGDTIAIVNISNFTGFDSLSWIVPTNADVHFLSDSLLLVSIVSGGWFDVTLIGYIDTCSFTFTKPVFFGTEKPNFDENYSDRGIKELVVYPNPTTGTFQVEFELGVNQNYTIVVTNVNGQLVNGMQVSGSGTTANHTFVFPIGIARGNYRLHIVSDFDAKQVAINLID